MVLTPTHSSSHKSLKATFLLRLHSRRLFPCWKKCVVILTSRWTAASSGQCKMVMPGDLVCDSSNAVPNLLAPFISKLNKNVSSHNSLFDVNYVTFWRLARSPVCVCVCVFESKSNRKSWKIYSAVGSQVLQEDGKRGKENLGSFFRDYPGNARFTVQVHRSMFISISYTVIFFKKLMGWDQRDPFFFALSWNSHLDQIWKAKAWLTPAHVLFPAIVDCDRVNLVESIRVRGS